MVEVAYDPAVNTLELGKNAVEEAAVVHLRQAGVEARLG